MSLKINKAEFMFGEKAGDLQMQLEEETGVKWTIERTCEGCKHEIKSKLNWPCVICTHINKLDYYEVSE